MLIVIDGLDGSGKSTQAELVTKKLQADGKNVMLISYPNYSNPSSTLVKMYLNGELSKNAEDINAYAASSFYAVDRYAGFKQHWEKFYKENYIIIASRYVSSNAIHQMVKLEKSEWNNFLAWLSDYEYNKLGLPKPNKVIFLDMKRSVADKLIMQRYDGDETKKDIHESNKGYLEKCQAAAHFAAKAENWNIVSCCDGQNPFSIETITKGILRIIEK